MDSGILIFLLEQKKAFAVSISLWAQIALLHSSLLPSRLVPALRRPPPVRCTFVLLFCYTQYLWFFFFSPVKATKWILQGDPVNSHSGRFLLISAWEFRWIQTSGLPCVAQLLGPHLGLGLTSDQSHRHLCVYLAECDECDEVNACWLSMSPPLFCKLVTVSKWSHLHWAPLLP